MDSFIKKIKNFVNNILIKTKRFNKPIAFTLSACFILVAVILCSFFVRNNAKDNNEEKEVLMGTEQTAPSSEPISESTTEPTETETEPTEASTEPTEIPTEPETEVPTEPEPDPEIEFTITARDTAPEGEPIEFSILTEDYGADLFYAKFRPILIEAPIANGPVKTNIGYAYNRKFIIITARSSEEFESNFISYLRLPTKRYNSYYSLEKYDESYFEEKALLILYQGNDKGNVGSVVKDGSELCICDSMGLDQSGMKACVSWELFDFIEVNKADLNGIDTVSYFVEAK